MSSFLLFCLFALAIAMAYWFFMRKSGETPKDGANADPNTAPEPAKQIEGGSATQPAVAPKADDAASVPQPAPTSASATDKPSAPPKAKPAKPKASKAPKPKSKSATAKPKAAKPSGQAPLFQAPDAAPDKLTTIKGIGPVAEQQLKEQGITTFAQIAAFTASDIQRISDNMPFSARQIETWQDQAKAL